MFSAHQPAEVLRGKMGVSSYFRSNFYLEASPVAHPAPLGMSCFTVPVCPRGRVVQWMECELSNLGSNPPTIPYRHKALGKWLPA